jgi:hypothetical protein
MKLVIRACLGAALVAGCNGSQGGGGGGGKAASPPAIQQTRDQLGNAYVAAARTHADALRGDFSGAQGAIRDVRQDLADAKRSARLENQARINDADQLAIRVQRQVEGRAVDAHADAGKLVDTVRGLFGSVALPMSRPAGGGGGGQQLVPTAGPDDNTHVRVPRQLPLPEPRKQDQPVPAWQP